MQKYFTMESYVIDIHNIGILLHNIGISVMIGYK